MALLIKHLCINNVSIQWKIQVTEWCKTEPICVATQDCQDLNKR